MFKSKKQFKEFPVRFVWRDDVVLDVPIQVLITVPKRNIKSAVNRNRIKRQIREIYRLNKSELVAKIESSNKKVVLGILYLGKPNPNYELLEAKIKNLFSQLITEI